MTRYQVQEKIAYSLIGKFIAKMLKKTISKYSDYRIGWIQQEMAEFGIK